MAAGEKIIGAGLRDAKIKDSNGVKYDLYGVINASGEPQSEQVEVKGDDKKLGTFNFGNSEEVTVEVNALSFDTLEALTGNPMSQSPSGVEIAGGTASNSNPPYVELVAYSQAIDELGNKGYFFKKWHKARLISEPSVGQEQETELTQELTFEALPTSVDIEGNALASERIYTKGFFIGDIPA